LTGSTPVGLLNYIEILGTGFELKFEDESLVHRSFSSSGDFDVALIFYIPLG
jgi:hypothetical protein